MIITKTIPETQHDEIIRQITFLVEEKVALVQIDVIGGNDVTRTVRVDLTDDLANATTTQRATIKGFFKKVMALAYKIDASLIPDTVFEENA